MVARGEIWWGEAPVQKGRPFLVISRDAANAVMGRVIVAPLTTRIPGVPSELVLGADAGLPQESAASFDNMQPFPKAMLVRRVGVVPPERSHEICATAAATLDC